METGSSLLARTDPHGSGTWPLGRSRLSPLKHPGSVGRAIVSPDGRIILTTCSDNTARLWDINAEKLRILSLPHRASVLDAVFSPDGLMVATACADGMARLWDARTGEAIRPATAPQERRPESVIQA